MSLLLRKFLAKNHSTCNLRRLGAVLQLKRNLAIDGTNFEISSNYQQVTIPNVPLITKVFEDVKNWSDKIAVECAVTGKKLTYDQLKTNIKNLDRNLRKKLKLKENDVVAILLPNVPEFIVSSYAIIRAGLVATTLNPLYTPDEISRQLLDSNAKAIITLNELCPSVKAAQTIMKRQIPIITVSMQEGASNPEGTINFKEFTDSDADVPDVQFKNTHDIIFMPYSSGTTGLPKGVELTNYNLTANLCQLGSPLTNIFESTTASHQDVVPAVLPLFHIYGFTATACKLLAGCKVITIPKFTPELYLQTILKHRPDCLLLVPPIMLFLTAHPSVKPEYLESVRTVMSGAAPLGALDEEKFLKKFRKDIYVCQGYGLSETSPVVTITSKHRPKAPGSIGEPVSNTKIKVVSLDDGKAVGPNQQGELLVKGPQVMKQYHNKPEETKNTFTEDGWLRTGDMVYYNENQMVFVTDRIKELIKVKGFQVPPAELEEVIRDYEGVGDAAVIGVPHDQHGEVPRAFVVPKPGSTLDAKKLQEFVASKVAHYKQLSGGVAVVDTIPKNPSGKILRRQLKQEFLEAAAKKC